LLVVESCPTVVGVITRKDVIMGGDEFLEPGAFL
jgi:chloride channel 7